MNNNYCPLIFHSIYIERSFHTIDVAPCCLAKKQSLPQQSINLLNNDYFVNLREQNKNNLKSTECSVCWDLEAIGGESKRQVTIDQYKRNAIPLFGKTISEDLKMKVMQNNVKELYICLDKDAQKHALQHAEYFMNNGVEVYLVDLKEKDPADIGFENMSILIKETPKLTFEKYIMYKLNI